jgi:hypothetical protein
MLSGTICGNMYILPGGGGGGGYAGSASASDTLARWGCGWVWWSHGCGADGGCTRHCSASRSGLARAQTMDPVSSLSTVRELRLLASG